MKLKFIIPCLITGFALSSPAEESSQLDQVLAELVKLNEGLKRVEERMDKLENQIVEVSVEAVQTSTAASPGEESGTFIDKVVEAVQIREERVNFPWMDTNLWTTLKIGMTSEEVQGILGEPTLEDPSLHKKVDFVYTYRGRKVATGEKISGKVKFFRDKVIEIESP